MGYKMNFEVGKWVVKWILKLKSEEEGGDVIYKWAPHLPFTPNQQNLNFLFQTSMSASPLIRRQSKRHDLAILSAKIGWRCCFFVIFELKFLFFNLKENNYLPKKYSTYNWLTNPLKHLRSGCKRPNFPER